jgi:hypothetical protein
LKTSGIEVNWMRADFGSLALADIFNEAIHCCSIDVMLCVLPKAKRETDGIWTRASGPPQKWQNLSWLLEVHRAYPQPTDTRAGLNLLSDSSIAKNASSLI